MESWSVAAFWIHGQGEEFPVENITNYLQHLGPRPEVEQIAIAVSAASRGSGRPRFDFLGLAGKGLRDEGVEEWISGVCPVPTFSSSFFAHK